MVEMNVDCEEVALVKLELLIAKMKIALNMLNNYYFRKVLSREFLSQVQKSTKVGRAEPFFGLLKATNTPL